MQTTDPEPSTGSSGEHMAKSQKGEENTKGPPGTANVREVLIHIHRNWRHYVRCDLCSKDFDTVKKFTFKGKIPSIAIYTGSVTDINLND